MTKIRQRRPSPLSLALGLMAVLLVSSFPPSRHAEAKAEAEAQTIFVEAEAFQPSSSAAWAVARNLQTQRASLATTLWGGAADAPADAVAATTLTLAEPGTYRVWVRYLHVAAWRGPFRLTLAAAPEEADTRPSPPLASHVFDREPLPDVADWEYAWQSFDVELPAGDLTLSLARHEPINCVGYVRHVDCLLLTTDMSLVPDHQPYGPQTLLRITLGEGLPRPVYLLMFADHYRDPWYAYYAIGRDGLHEALEPPPGQMLQPGEPTPWCNLTPTIYQDSGAALNFSLRHTYYEKADRFRAKLEFGRPRRPASPPPARSRDARSIPPSLDDIEVVKTFDVEAQPNGLVVVVPPDLESDANLARLQRDRDFAIEIGRLADAFPWPTYGQPPSTLPFLVAANIGGYDLPVDAAVTAREQKTLDYFGFNGGPERVLHGLWFMKNNSYCDPDRDTMRQRIQEEVERFDASGRQREAIAVLMLMDEPAGQPASFAAADPAYRDRFRDWLTARSLRPADLLVTDWDQVQPVDEPQRDRFPALHYYTQLFRTRALGDFMATQRQIIEKAYDRSFPTVVNFSDSAVYQANFASQGVDYFELLDADDQNAIWGEDWANLASTYQCGAFNVALMQAAARRRGQTIGHYLIAHAGRTSWDIKTKAVSETARGVRIWYNFSYGPSWGTHEGGPAWKSHVWHRLPEMWAANAEITREIGSAEPWLLAAQPAPADVALLYSSSSDIWTRPDNLAFGFDRMHTWLALTHAQTPVDILPEREIDRLDRYKVVYLSGPNLTRDAAAALRAWVQAGGTLWLSAGAAQRDEFNRPLPDGPRSLTPVEPAPLDSPDPFHSPGRYLALLRPLDTVTWGGQSLEVLSVKQPLSLPDSAAEAEETQAEILATFADGQPAVIRTRAGQGQVYTLGFLPALSYIKPALVARQALEQQAEADAEARAKAEQQQAAAAQAADQPLATSAAVAIAPTSEPTATLPPGADRARLARSYNPWLYPAGIRDLLLAPVHAAQVVPALTCDTPLIDAVALPCPQGTLIALANHTLQPLDQVTIRLQTATPATRVESVRHGPLPLSFDESGALECRLPLDATDFIKVHHEPSADR